MTYQEAVKELYFALYGHGDNFHVLLYQLIAKADPGNKARLRLGFPMEVLAFDDWQQSGNENEFFESIIARV